MSDLGSFSFRHPAEDDLPEVASVLGAEERALRGHVTLGPDELRDWWRLYDLDASWLVETGDCEPVGFSGFLAHGDEVTAWVVVDPRYTGRGVSTELLARAEHRVRELGGDQLRAGALVENRAARLLLEGLGFREIRRFFRMQVDFDDEPPQPAELEEISIATFRDEDAQVFYATMNEAMADDWGFTSMPFEEWKRFRLEAPETDTSLWFLAWDGEEAAGVIRCDGKKFGGGFVGALGVRRPWRGRGVGTGLLHYAFGEYYRRGVKRVSLGVDAQNQSGATRLYERAGMRAVSEVVTFEKELA